MNKLQEVIKAKYGKESQVRFLTSVSPVSSGSFGVMKRDVTLPIELSDGFYITVIIRDGYDLNDRQKREISDLAGIYLGRSTQKISVDVREANDNVLGADIDSGLVPFGTSFIDEDEINLVPHLEIRETKRTKDFSEKVYVFNKSSISATKLSSIFHDLAQTWAQMRWEDVRSGVSLTQDLRSLGRVTLVIESWQKLPAREKKLLLNSMTELRFEENSPYFLILNQNPKEQSDLEMFACIDAERLPMDTAQLEQTLDLLLSDDQTPPDFNPVN